MSTSVSITDRASRALAWMRSIEGRTEIDMMAGKCGPSDGRSIAHAILRQQQLGQVMKGEDLVAIVDEVRRLRRLEAIGRRIVCAARK
jgi:hypothetical protein